MTLEPERDTVDLLRSYADVRSVGAGWCFLRASRRDTDTGNGAGFRAGVSSTWRAGTQPPHGVLGS